MSAKTRNEPRNFFLSERHELQPIPKDGGGGGQPKLRNIDWHAKSANLSVSFSTVRTANQSSPDPNSRRHYFVTAAPATIPKYTEKKGVRQDADEVADFRAERSVDLVRLGFDVLAVDREGRALVHTPASRFDQLERNVGLLPVETARARNRWLAVESIGVPDATWRVDLDWFAKLATEPSECIVEMQPVLDRAEIEAVATALFRPQSNAGAVARVLAWGTDYSGRAWYRSRMTKDTAAWIAHSFVSVQLIHPPYHTDLAASEVAAGDTRGGPPISPPPSVAAVAGLPIVAVVDAGVSPSHPILSAYRTGRWASPKALPPGHVHHAAKVASRIVFGDVASSSGPVVGDCAFFDIAAGCRVNNLTGRPSVEDKDIIASMTASLGASAGLRTFVCAFDTQPTGLLSKSDREEKLRLARDLDNFIADNDVIVVVSAGNVPPETRPRTPYPRHVDEQEWQLGPWASTHNTLTCGGFVARREESNEAQYPNAPSPFTRAGPGFADAPGVPDGADHAGGELGGVLVLDDNGLWNNTKGTSFAAPLLAREVAASFVALRRFVPEGGRASSALVKAFLALTATPLGADLPAAYQPLAKRTLGRGRMTADRLRRPSADSATFLWQGVIEGPDDYVRVLLPLPMRWLSVAKQPELRLCVAWNSYVNDSASELWCCRRVEALLRPGAAENESFRGASRHLGRTYPLALRTFDLASKDISKAIVDDNLVLWVSYKTDGMAPMLPFVPEVLSQQAAFVAELRDASGLTSPLDEVIALESKIGIMDRLRAAIVPVSVQGR